MGWLYPTDEELKELRQKYKSVSDSPKHGSEKEWNVKYLKAERDVIAVILKIIVLSLMKTIHQRGDGGKNDGKNDFTYGYESKRK